MYDLIGDIHGHAGPLRALLDKLGYAEGSEGWRHPNRRVIFLGDFVDRGPEQVESVALVRQMVEQGQALAVMGNHEFNAVAYASPDPTQPGSFLRSHSSRNRRQHQTYLTQVGEGSALHQAHVAWFKTLPLYLDLPGLRVVHACWHPDQIARLTPCLDERQRIREEAWPRLSTPGNPDFEALETLLKGMEIPLPNGYEFHDKDNNLRRRIRTEWWNQEALTYRDLAMVPPEMMARIPHLPAPTHVLPGYQGNKPLFVGHYWMSGRPTPLHPHIACLDYSVAARDGKLCAYRWQGESRLLAEHFCWVDNPP